MSKPVIFNSSEKSKTRLSQLLAEKRPIVQDSFAAQLEELFHILHPSHSTTSIASIEYDKIVKTMSAEERWIYFPWKNQIAHLLPEDEFYTVRTNRNRNLISQKEQQTLKNFSVAIFGLSIGAVIGKALIQMGISNFMKVADFDHLSLSNLNRLPASILDIGKKKTELFSQSVYEMNPYQILKIEDKKIKTDSIERFLTSGFTPNALIDAVDDFQVKIKLRIIAKKLELPVLMFTNIHDRIVVDVERYDLDQQYKLLHSFDEEQVDEVLNHKIDAETIKKYSIQFVGKENVSQRARESVSLIGHELVGRPQLFGTLSVSAGVACNVIRKLSLGEKLESGRYTTDIDQITSK